jgi:hypothetical protein
MIPLDCAVFIGYHAIQITPATGGKDGGSVNR